MSSRRQEATRTHKRASADRCSLQDNLRSHPLAFLGATLGLLAILVIKSLFTRSGAGPREG